MSSMPRPGFSAVRVALGTDTAQVGHLFFHSSGYPVVYSGITTTFSVNSVTRLFQVRHDAW